MDKEFEKFDIRNIGEIYDALCHLWCAETCAPRMRKDWTKENMTLGQCSITSFLIQDILGGEVYGVPLPEGGYHCFNYIDGKDYDTTAAQFGDTKLVYNHKYPQYREEHFIDKDKYQRYLLLRKKLLTYLSHK